MWFIQDWRRVELRASLLIGLGTGGKRPARRRQFLGDIGRRRQVRLLAFGLEGDRKSTRLNSSHANISYAVFCLKKKKRKSHTDLHHSNRLYTAHAPHLRLIS